LVKEKVMLQEVDISGLDYPALTGLRERIDQRVREMREAGGPALRERFVAEAAALGLTIEEIVQAGTKRCGRPAKERDVAE
jgi:hypothetical protein